MLHHAALAPQLADKPKLSMMLPDPARYSPQTGSPLNSTSTSQPFLEPRPQVQQTQSFSLPPIRELLKEATPGPVGVSGSTSNTTTSTTLSSPVQQPVVTPAPRPLPAVYHTSSPYFNGPAYPSNNSPPPSSLPHSIGRSASLPNYLSHHPRIPSPVAQHHTSSFSGLATSSSSHQLTSHTHAQSRIPNMIPTPESRSESASPVSSTDSTYFEPTKEAKLTSRKKRQNLPRQTTMILLSWLSEHLDRPYPNSREKYELLIKTRLTIQQLDNWFINARRRKINELRKLKENDQSISLMF
ncbi:Homeobox protein TOS8 [Cyberlindnera fabianii]|nr:Homeobox protein TOS8 [Cyberlindnera fabianii]